MAGQYFQDGFYDYSDVQNAMKNHFESEKELCDYIQLNMALFVADCLNEEVTEFSREYPLNGRCRAGAKGNRRVDFFIKTKSGQNIILECKNPYYKSEIANAVGQCLSYIALFELMEQRIDRMIILSTKIDSTLPLIIQRFNLPIEFIAFDKDKFLKYVGNGSTARK